MVTGLGTVRPAMVTGLGTVRPAMVTGLGMSRAVIMTALDDVSLLDRGAFELLRPAMVTGLGEALDRDPVRGRSMLGRVRYDLDEAKLA
jgi:hypothetical protein